jgi:inorganic pyrophosphatase
MPNLINLPPFTEDGDVNVVVETPRGSRVKFDYDPKLGAFTLSKSLLTGLTYPHDWGFVPSTRADDGDPIDIMVVHDAATFPGIVLTCRVIGILKIEQKSKGKTERNDRLFAVPRDSHSEQALKNVRDLSQPIQQELEKFSRRPTSLRTRSSVSSAGGGPRQPCRPSRIPPNLSKRTANSAYAAFSVSPSLPGGGCFGKALPSAAMTKRHVVPQQRECSAWRQRRRNARPERNVKVPYGNRFCRKRSETEGPTPCYAGSSNEPA